MTFPATLQGSYKVLPFTKLDAIREKAKLIAMFAVEHIEDPEWMTVMKAAEIILEQLPEEG